MGGVPQHRGAAAHGGGPRFVPCVEDEAFDLWKVWADVYSDESPSYALIHEVRARLRRARGGVRGRLFGRRSLTICICPSPRSRSLGLAPLEYSRSAAPTFSSRSSTTTSSTATSSPSSTRSPRGGALTRRRLSARRADASAAAAPARAAAPAPDSVAAGAMTTATGESRRRRRTASADRARSPAAPSAPVTGSTSRCRGVPIARALTQVGLQFARCRAYYHSDTRTRRK